MAKYPANKNGFKFGEYVLANDFPARIAGRSNAQISYCEVFGFAHEVGDVYNKNIKVITKEEFYDLLKETQFKVNHFAIEKLNVFDKENEK